MAPINVDLTQNAEIGWAPSSSEEPPPSRPGQVKNARRNSAETTTCTGPSARGDSSWALYASERVEGDQEQVSVSSGWEKIAYTVGRGKPRWVTHRALLWSTL